MLDPARRARSVLVTSANVEVGLLDKRVLLDTHVVDSFGAVVFAGRSVARSCLMRLLAGEASPPLDVVATDVAPVPQPDRVRGVVRMSGPVELVTEPLSEDVLTHLRVGPADPVVRFVPREVGLDWRVERPAGQPGGRSVAVPAPLYAGARPDGLAGWEGPWATHLAGHHGDVARTLAERVTELAEGARLRPLLADEGGVVIRAYEGEGYRDVRVPFPRRAQCPCEAVAALGLLLTT